MKYQLTLKLQNNSKLNYDIYQFLKHYKLNTETLIFYVRMFYKFNLIKQFYAH